ncbi:MAG: hypothetical protein NXI10_10870 [bacterium]|nr:hypothetical protein [bacterium]
MRHFLLLFLLISFQGISQEFPEDWLGSYKGEMLIANLGRPTDTIPVEYEMVTIEEDSIWSYKMTFLSEKFGTIVKDYKIVATSKDNKNQYLLDENNGIVMEITLMDGTFYGMYEVMDMMFITTMKYTDGNIFYDLFAAPKANPMVTSTTDEEEEIEAKSYRPVLHQTALFIREK